MKNIIYRININEDTDFYNIISDFLDMKKYYESLNSIKEKNLFRISLYNGHQFINYFTFNNYKSLIKMTIETRNL